MTIAACYSSSEGIVLGADSTSTMYVPSPDGSGTEHHYNHAQKIFQIGERSTIGMTLWGLGDLPERSFRTLIAEFADRLVSHPPNTMRDVAAGWADFFWRTYCDRLSQVVHRARELAGKTLRTSMEDEELAFLVHRLSGGFCIGGYLLHDRTPSAYEIVYRQRERPRRTQVALRSETPDFGDVRI